MLSRDIINKHKTFFVIRTAQVHAKRINARNKGITITFVLKGPYIIKLSRLVTLTFFVEWLEIILNAVRLLERCRSE